MNSLLDFLLRSFMAIILAIAAVVSAVITFPFLAVFWLYKQLRNLVK